jgi:predicted AlkP superfamily phosphohydrolase/phosphomutase
MTDRKRVLILGLDGADWRFIDPLLAGARLPALAGLIAQGARAPLASCLPPLSAPAWVTFLLGQGPGSHGVADFLERDARLYAGTTGHVVTSNDYPKQTIFDLAGAFGLRVASVLVPMTYPPWPVNGLLVSGGFMPGGRLSTYPSELSETLKVGSLDIGNRLLEYPEERQVSTLHRQLERAEEVGRAVLRRERFDLAMVAVHTPDNAHHCFWGRGDGPGEHSLIDRFYVEVDRFVGSLLEGDGWDLVVVMSDHGGGPRPTRQLSINRWLADLGLLRLRGGYRSRASSAASFVKHRHRRLVYRVRRWAPQRLQRAVSAITQSSVAIDWRATTAYGVHLFHPFFGIEMNLRGRQEHGIVEAGQLHEARQRVAAKLRQSIREHGLPVRRVMTCEEAFGDGADPRLPDIVLHLEQDTEGTNELTPKAVEDARPAGPNHSRCSHGPDGILVAAGSGVRQGSFQRAHIEDLAPTILSYLGVPVPGAMTGRVLSELFAPGTLREQRAAVMPGGPSFDGEAEITEEQEEAILASLRGLGYVE